MADDDRPVLVQEYLHIQKTVEDFDQKALTIKAWSVTFSCAGLGLAHSQGQPMVLLISAFSALVFWIVEALWKNNQQAYYLRLTEIETHFAPQGAPTKPLRIKKAWSESWHRSGKHRMAMKIMAWPHIALPHIIVVAAGIALFLLHAPIPKN